MQLVGRFGFDQAGSAVLLSLKGWRVSFPTSVMILAKYVCALFHKTVDEFCVGCVQLGDGNWCQTLFLTPAIWKYLILSKIVCLITALQLLLCLAYITRQRFIILLMSEIEVFPSFSFLWVSVSSQSVSCLVAAVVLSNNLRPSRYKCCLY